VPKAPETAALPPFPEVTAHFEDWLRSRITVNEADLAYKHEQMDTGVFPFMRATFYRWMQLWPVLCPKLAAAPSVLAVGDLHVDNFGTWRDSEGRLIWGVNDFDEAYPLPYTLDLVRLAASMRMAAAIDRLRLTPRLACDILLAGYKSAIERGGRPFVLAENHPVLRREASGVLRDPVRFWQTMTALPEDRSAPVELVTQLRAAMPKDVEVRYLARRAGLGSLGHVRVVAVGEHHGGYIAREGKALAPSACIWASDGEGKAIHYATIVKRAVRDPDPFLQLRGDWVLRRLAPDCSRIVATTVTTMREQEELARAMGVETANIHLGAAASRIDEVRRDLASRPEGWLRSASKTMARATQRDFESWRRRTTAGARQASK
jgi:hypothetical protein